VGVYVVSAKRAPETTVAISTDLYRCLMNAYQHSWLCHQFTVGNTAIQTEQERWYGGVRAVHTGVQSFVPRIWDRFSGVWGVIGVRLSSRAILQEPWNHLP